MSDTVIKVDENRAAALEAVVSAGGAESVQAAVESAVDSWLTDQALNKASDEALHRLWSEGLNSGVAGTIDFAALKAEARRS
jgi:Arc/MetJ-type ribon-helix-helix transcriptional regulator